MSSEEERNQALAELADRPRDEGPAQIKAETDEYAKAHEMRRWGSTAAFVVAVVVSTASATVLILHDGDQISWAKAAFTFTTLAFSLAWLKAAEQLALPLWHVQKMANSKAAKLGSKDSAVSAVVKELIELAKELKK